jgi:omega-6 fatty acid desaturase (delta-12 desaturase)
MSTQEIHGKDRDSSTSWRETVAAYERPVLRRSLWQLGSTLVAYIALWCVACLAIDISYWVTAFTTSII